MLLREEEKQFTISENDLDTYFIKKDGTRINTEKVLETMTGEHYTKRCFAYIFQYLPS